MLVAQGFFPMQKHTQLKVCASKRVTGSGRTLCRFSIRQRLYRTYSPVKNMQERNKLKIVYFRFESIVCAVLYANIVSFSLAGPVPRWNCTVTSLVQILPAVSAYAIDSALHDIVYALDNVSRSCSCPSSCHLCHPYWSLFFL